MKKFILSIILLTLSVLSFAQAPKPPVDSNISQTFSPFPFRLYPTQNMWNFIKLDTRNGKIWQVQYGLKSEARFEIVLNGITLTSSDKEENNRFALYPTQNFYSFILIDQLDGRTWQVQWSTEPENRGIFPIN
ncbi:MAG: hypothetical protein EBQ97_02430 [Bacteroidetes bacterium]|nr:hypothetical protein [Bacteroidota bacterium]